MPQRALEDALHAQVSDFVIEQEKESAATEAKQVVGPTSAHVEHFELSEGSKNDGRQH